MVAPLGDKAFANQVLVVKVLANQVLTGDVLDSNILVDDILDGDILVGAFLVGSFLWLVMFQSGGLDRLLSLVLKCNIFGYVYEGNSRILVGSINEITSFFPKEFS